MDFFRLRPPALLPCVPSTERKDSPDRRLIVCTRFSKKFLNADGSSSGCTLAGTQSSRDGSASSSSPVGAIGGISMSDTPENCSRSGSVVFPTSMDMRRRACRLLSSWAMSLGLSMLVSGNCEVGVPGWTSRRDAVGDGGGRGDSDASLGLVCSAAGPAGEVRDFLLPGAPLTPLASSPAGPAAVAEPAAAERVWSDVVRTSRSRSSSGSSGL